MLNRALALDAALRAWLAAHHSPLLDAVMLAASRIGQRAAVWLILGAVAALARPAWRAPAWQMVLAVVLAFAVTDAMLKPAIGRARPFTASAGVRVIDTPPATASFPSGHAASAFAAAFVLTRAWPAARAALWALAGLIAASRVYVGVHYPLDVVAGALVGLACGIVALGGIGRVPERAHFSDADAGASRRQEES